MVKKYNNILIINGREFQNRRSCRYTCDFVTHEVPSCKTVGKAAYWDPRPPQGQLKGAQERSGTPRPPQGQPKRGQKRSKAPQREHCPAPNRDPKTTPRATKGSPRGLRVLRKGTVLYTPNRVTGN